MFTKKFDFERNNTFMLKNLRNKITDHQVSVVAKTQSKIKSFKNDTLGGEVLEWLGVILCVAIVVLILAKVLNSNGSTAFTGIFNKGVNGIMGAEYTPG